ncbi:Uncharacterised protein [Rhodococcus wratislaviensis]|uniref:Uncharacterized protein n=1 Tax=Rhodococcus wratislaviensis TaxID=44752 RepID=A0AB38F8V6_RHOWR|nr:Uncharacterised protein [Rhodococcus wratislaviensis]
MNTCKGGRLLVRISKPKTACGNVSPQNVFEPRFEEGHLTRLKLRQFGLINVDAENIVTELSHTRGMRCSKISGTEYGDSHCH